MTESGGENEPRWLSSLVVRTLHTDLILQHGGEPGLRDESLLESAIARPRNRWVCRDDPDLATLAAAYAWGILRNRPFVDGNKRTALMAIYTFLWMNGRELEVPEPEAVAVTSGSAAGDLSEEELSEWFRAHARPGERQGG